MNRDTQKFLRFIGWEAAWASTFLLAAQAAFVQHNAEIAGIVFCIGFVFLAGVAFDTAKNAAWMLVIWLGSLGALSAIACAIVFL